ncbi:MAG: class I fructose-bisphosphate aldolase [Pseudonocardiaceae bacterium]
MITQLGRTARDLVSGGRGILAADESIRTVSARLEQAGVPPSEQNRRAYRQMLVTTPELHRGISGVLLSDETFGQRLDNGVPFPQAVTELGMLPGIRVDTGTTPLAGAPGETVTEGLDNLRKRLTGYGERGARFATWRAVIRIDEGLPTERALRANAHALARYAALCQETGVVPIIEPDVLADGAHTIRTCADVTSVALLLVMRELHDAGVDISGVVLTPAMVLAGMSSGCHPDPDEVADRTVRALQLVVSAELAGVAFLSGAQSPVTATENLAATARKDAPWPLTFSFGRALVDPALAAWRGDPVRVQAGQQALAQRVEHNNAAVQGRAVNTRTQIGVPSLDSPLDDAFEGLD